MPQARTVDDEIKTVFDTLTEMFDRVDELLADAINAVFRGDTVLAQRVRQEDAKVDALELQIDWVCERILNNHHLEGENLRKILTAIKINKDLERIGDHCKNVAKRVTYLERTSLWRSQTHIMEMADVVRAILRKARQTFTQQDRLLARKVLAHDRQVDREHKAVLATAVTLCRTHPEEAEAFVHLVLMSKALERIADHARNIARSSVFFIEGVDIRHKHLARPADNGHKAGDCSP